MAELWRLPCQLVYVNISTFRSITLGFYILYYFDCHHVSQLPSQNALQWQCDHNIWMGNNGNKGSLKLKLTLKLIALVRRQNIAGFAGKFGRENVFSFALTEYY